nr:hypothetical protein [Tanacetum cinerariifolium]
MGQSRGGGPGYHGWTCIRFGEWYGHTSSWLVHLAAVGIKSLLDAVGITAAQVYDPHAHSILNHNSIHQSRGSCVVGLFAVIDNEFEEWAWSCEFMSFWLATATVGIPASLSVLAVLKPERLKVDRARMCEEASKVESCPSEIILDDLLALDSIMHFDFE